MNARSALYLIAQLFGDASAINNGSVVKRIARRSAGRYMGKSVLRRLIKRSR